MYRSVTLKIQGITESIFQHLKSEIITGNLAPNERLSEEKIAAGLGVSRAPLREALRLLENGNFVIRLPRRGAYVAGLSVENLEKVYEARTMIESYAIDLFKTKRTRDLPRAEKALEAAAKLSIPSTEDQKGMLGYVITFSDFHVGLIEGTENEWIIQFYKSLTFNLARYQFICLYIPGLTTNSFEMHKQILDHIRKGRYESAKKALLIHIQRTASLIKEEIRKNSCGEEKGMRIGYR
jgi:DNA-binding GntR family transcriptional regulator